MRLPSTSPITLPFGATSAPYSPSNKHTGVDFAYIPDDRIYAPFTGRVIVRPLNGNDGNGVYMSNGNQFHGLLHLSMFLVTDGQQVTEGQVIGVMGETGYAIGRHLHWCVKVNNVFVDPLTLTKENDMSLQADLDLANYKLEQSEKALRAREKQAEVYEQQIADLQKQVSGGDSNPDQLLGVQLVKLIREVK